jgi:hypothetical protein
LPEGGKMVQSTKNLSAYFARHCQRPSFKATIPAPPPLLTIGDCGLEATRREHDHGKGETNART